MPARKAPLKSSPQPKQNAGSSRPRDYWAVGLVLIAFAAYANSLVNGFVTDDQLQILKNQLIADFHQIPAIFSRSAAGFMGNTDNYYRPIHLLVYMALHAVAGFNPGAYHLFMVFLHAANTALLYFAIRRMIGPPAVAIAASALFALHPIHTEVVDWVAAVPDALVTTFVLLGFWLFLRQNAAPRGMQIAGHCGVYMLALLTKEPGVMLLPLYAGYEWIGLRRRVRDLRQNAPLYAAMLVTFGTYLACRIAALGGIAPAQQRFYRLTPLEFALSATVEAARYLGKLVLPIGLNYYYVFEPVRGITPALVFSALALLGVAVIAYRAAGGQAPAPAIAYGVFWIAVTLAPALNLTGIGRSVFSERYLYLPSAGFVWIAGVAWYWAYRRAPGAARAAGVVILAAFALQVTVRNRDWRDNITLLEKTIRQSPGGPELHADLATSYAERGDLDRAIPEAKTAVALLPDSATFRLNLGNMLLSRNPREAVPVFQELIRRHPSYSDAHYCLGLAWKALGDSAAATAQFERTLAIYPEYVDAMLALSGIYRDAGRTPEAIALCRRAAAARPANPEPHIKLAVLYLETRAYPDAIRSAQEALRVAPDSDRAYLAHYCLGIAYGETGAREAELAELAASMRLNPGFQQARDAYQSALTGSGAGK